MKRIEKMAIATIMAAGMVMLFLLACKRESPSLPPSPLAIQEADESLHSVSWGISREVVITGVQPISVELVHEFQVVAGGTVVFSETIPTGITPATEQGYGTLNDVAYTWPGAPGVRYRRTYWQDYDGAFFEAFVSQYGTEFVCEQNKLCAMRRDDNDEIEPWEGAGWYQVGATGHIFYLALQCNDY
jgi:hypothetical protein